MQELVLIRDTEETEKQLDAIKRTHPTSSLALSHSQLSEKAELRYCVDSNGTLGYIILFVDKELETKRQKLKGILSNWQMKTTALSVLRKNLLSELTSDTPDEDFSLLEGSQSETKSSGKSSSQTNSNTTEDSVTEQGKRGVSRKLAFDNEFLDDRTLDSGDEAEADSEKSHQQENSLNAEQQPPKEKSDEEKVDDEEDNDAVVFQPPAQQPIMVFKWPEEKTPAFSLTENILLFEAQDIENIPTALQMISRAAHISPRINEATHIHMPIKNQQGHLELTFDKKRGISPDVKWIKLSTENIHQTIQNSVRKSLRKVIKNASVKTEPQAELSFTTQPPATPTKGNDQAHTPASPPSGQYLPVGCTPQKPNVEHVSKKNKIILPMLSDYTLETLTIDKIKELEKPYKEIKCQRFRHTHPERDNDFNAILERKKTSAFVPTQLPIDLDLFLKKNKPWFLGVRRFFGRPIAKRYDEVKAYIAESRHQRKIKYEQKENIKFKPLDKPLNGTLKDFTTQIKEELSYGERRKYRSLVRESFQSLFLSRKEANPNDHEVQNLARHYAADHNYAVKLIKASRSSR